METCEKIEKLLLIMEMTIHFQKKTIIRIERDGGNHVENNNFIKRHKKD